MDLVQQQNAPDARDRSLPRNDLFELHSFIQNTTIFCGFNLEWVIDRFEHEKGHCK